MSFRPTCSTRCASATRAAAYYFTGQVPGSVPGWVAGGPVGAVVISGSTASNGASQITLAGANTGSNNQAVRNLFTVDDHVFWTARTAPGRSRRVAAAAAIQRQPGAEPVWTGVVLHPQPPS